MLRALRKAPAFTLTAAGTLGLAIGASAAIYTLVESVPLDPLPYANADRLVVLQGSAPGTDTGDEFDPATIVPLPAGSSTAVCGADIKVE